MVRFNWLMMLALVMFLANCSDEPLITANEPEAVSVEEESLAKGGATKSKVVIDDSFVDGPYFISCLNEEVTFTISLHYEAGVVTTPSGHELWNGWLDEYSNEFTGATTGDHWVGSGIAHNSSITKSDGTYRDFEAIRETFVKDGSNDTLKLMWHWRITPENPWSFELISCTVLGPN